MTAGPIKVPSQLATGLACGSHGKDQFFHHNNMTEIQLAKANLQ